MIRAIRQAWEDWSVGRSMRIAAERFHREYAARFGPDTMPVQTVDEHGNPAGVVHIEIGGNA